MVWERLRIRGVLERVQGGVEEVRDGLAGIDECGDGQGFLLLVGR